MKYFLLLLLLFPILIGYAQIDEGFDNFDGPGMWVSPGGNTGSHDGDLCFNVIGNYLANEFYIFQSPMYDFSTWGTVELFWNQESSVRNGDSFRLYVYDNGWSYYDISNLSGYYGVTVATTTTALAFVLVTNGSGGLNGRYSHVRFLSIYDPTPLPVEQLEFTAKLLDNGTQLDWSTASEYNSNYFSLFRSVNGVTWDLIDEIQAAGFSTSLQQYQYLDYSILYNHVYYKLKQTDIDGVTQSWPPISIYRELNENVKRYNILGQDIKGSYKGLVIELKNGMFNKKIKN
jgi:hypothetical protein